MVVYVLICIIAIYEGGVDVQYFAEAFKMEYIESGEVAVGKCHRL